MRTSVVSITKGPRQTNFELLRLFAMFLVLIFHSDFLCTGYPNKSNLDESMVQTITKIFIESSSVVCVNIFVLISGWFGIKPTIKGLLNFIFQCVYFLTLTYLITCLLGINKVSLHGIKSCIFLLPESNWFIRAYIALYIISPILNVYLEKCNKKQLGTVLILFFAFQTIFGITNISIFISWGYSTFSFIGLYLLAQYAKRYILANYAWGGVYLLCVILNTAINIVVLNKDLNCNQILYSYVNPLVIIGALSLVLFTGQFKMKPIKFINFISQSAFSIYLLHASNSIFNSIYKPIVLKIYDSQVGINVLLSIFGFITIVSLIAILLDQPRKWLFKVFDEKFLRRFGNKIIYPNFGY